MAELLMQDADVGSGGAMVWRVAVDNPPITLEKSAKTPPGNSPNHPLDDPLRLEGKEPRRYDHNVFV